MTITPFERIETLCLDIGNTLISMDFDWIAAEVAARGLPCDASALRRAEAAARPDLSRRIVAGTSTEGGGIFHFYLRGILAHLPATRSMSPEVLDALTAALVPVLHVPGQAYRLWRSVMPGVPAALAALAALGLRLVALSNSDGTAERSLQEAGLRSFFSVVVDSGLVGFEKPDRRIFAYALRAAGATPDATLHVGDLYHVDVQGARGAGLHAALLDPYGDWQVDHCDLFPDLAAVARRFQEAQAGRA